MSGLLERIVASKRDEIETWKKSAPAEGATRTPCDVARALRKPGELALVCEVKFRSPSAGALSRAMDAGERAAAYAEAGASMVSVLCDQPFFDGSYDDVTKARAALDARGFARLPILAKEFVLDDVQIARARAAGADAILLIARIVTHDALASLARSAIDRGLEPFVEVVDEDELGSALDAGARVIGVNARDLDTLEMDAARAARVIARIPPDRVAVHFSGVRGPDDVARAAQTRADAALVGEALMREADPRDLLKRMLARAAKSSKM